MEERSWSRLAVAGVALAGAGLLVVFLAGFGYHHGWWSLRVAFGRRVLGLPLLGVLPIGTLLAMLGALLSLAGIAHAFVFWGFCAFGLVTLNHLAAGFGWRFRCVSPKSQSSIS